MRKNRVEIKAKRYISLIEIMIVFAIIGLVSTIVGIKSFSKIKTYSFEKAKASFVSRVHHARQLSAVSNADVFMFVEKKKSRNKAGYITCEITFDKHRKAKPQNIIKYKGAKIYMLEDNGDFAGDQFMLMFMSTGEIYPKKRIVITNLSGEKQQKDKYLIDISKLFIEEFSIKKN